MGFNPVDLAFGNMNALRSDNERLKAENAKLRELVGTLRGYLAGDTGPCDCCAMQGTCENHPAPPPCKYELDGEHAPVLGWIDDNLSELGADMWLQLLNAYDRKEVDEFVDRLREMGGADADAKR